MSKGIKKYFLIALIAMLVLVFTGCGGGGQQTEQKKEEAPKEAAPEKIKLIAAHVLAPTSPYQAGFEKLRDIVKEKTNGQIEIEIHHSASLGEEEQMIESLQMGTIDISTISAAPLTAFVKEYMACDLPFTFASPEEAYKFYDGEIGDILLEKTESLGMIGLGWWENGFRNFTNNVRPIATPADMKGLKIRTMNSPVHMASVKALGADAVPVPFGELYSALQQGVVDGEENPVANVHSSRFYEVQKHITLSRHFYDPSPLFISKKTMDKLTTEQQKIIKDAAIVARDYMRDFANDQEAGLVEDLKKNGMTVTVLTPEQIKAFQDATKDVYKQFVDKIGEDFLNKFYKAAGR
ncbi:MAG: DctP family TRAP transporter solute-binding subunit [Bacillota bacterium]